MIKAEKDTIVPLAFLAVLTASLVCNVYLGRIVQSDRLSAHASSTAPHEAKTEQKLDVMDVTQPEGGSLRIRLQNDRPTVLYVFAPTCGWCARNLQNIEALSVQTKDRYRFIGLSTGSHNLRGYLQKHTLPFPAYENISDADLKMLDFRGTPQTIVVSAAGIVEHNWSGAYAADGTEDTIQKYFSVRLPGLGLRSTPLPMTSAPARSEP